MSRRSRNRTACRTRTASRSRPTGGRDQNETSKRAPGVPARHMELRWPPTDRRSAIFWRPSGYPETYGFLLIATPRGAISKNPWVFESVRREGARSAGNLPKSHGGVLQGASSLADPALGVGSLLGASWGAFWGLFGLSGSALGPSSGPPGPSWEARAVLGRSGRPLEPSWGPSVAL